MEKQIMTAAEVSSVAWDGLESWVREQIQKRLQDVLEEEVTAFLGRKPHERKPDVDGEPGYRNGYGKPRRLTLSCGTVTVRRPRVRGLEERFESRILRAFKRRSQAVDEVLPELYLHGLSQGDFDLALRGLLGEDAPISATSVARLKAKWQGEYEAWKETSLAELEVVYLWVDGIYVKAGLEKEKAALLVVLAALSNGDKVFLAVEPGYRESTESWASVLRSLKQRGMNCPRLVCGDGHLGIWAGLREIFPEADEQRCWNHRIVNAQKHVPKKRQAEALEKLKVIPYADTRAEAEALKEKFQRWAKQQGYEKAARLLDDDWERMVAFYAFPKEHWPHLRTTNPVESPFSTVRLRTRAARRFKKVQNATAMIWKTLRVAEQSFRKLNAPELLKDIFLKAEYEDGIRAKATEMRDAA
jgi:putative transposase